MNGIFERHLIQLSDDFLVSFNDEERSITVYDMPLKIGFNRSAINILIDLPPDYPLSPPGVGGYGIYLDKELRYMGRKIRDFHPGGGPRKDRDLAWFCYETILWDPHYDTLRTLLAKIRNDITQAAEAAAPMGATSAPQYPTGIRNLLGQIASAISGR